MVEDDDVFKYRSFPFMENGLTVDDKLQELYGDEVDETTGNSLCGLRREHKMAKDVRSRYLPWGSTTYSVLADYLHDHDDLFKRMRSYLVGYLHFLNTNRKSHIRYEFQQLYCVLEMQIHAIDLELFYLRCGGDMMQELAFRSLQGTRRIASALREGRFDRDLAGMALADLSRTACAYNTGSLDQIYARPSVRRDEHEKRIASFVHSHYNLIDSVHPQTQDQEKDHYWCPVTQRYLHARRLGVVQLIPTCWGLAHTARLFDLPMATDPDIIWGRSNYIVVDKRLAILFDQRQATLVPSKTHQGRQ